MMNQEILIFNYLDHTCTEKEREQVEQLLEQDNQFLDLFLELQQANDLMLQNSLDEVSVSFTSNVMKQIKASETFQYTQQSTIAKFLLPFVLVLSFIIALNKIQLMPSQIKQILVMLPETTAFYLIGLSILYISIDFFLVRREMQSKT